MIFLPDAENRMIVSSFVWTKHRNVTDGQTNRWALAITAACIESNAPLYYIGLLVYSVFITLLS